MRQLCLFRWGVTTETTLFFESKKWGLSSGLSLFAGGHTRYIPAHHDNDL